MGDDFRARLRRVYLNQRTPAAYILLGLVTVGGVADSAQLQLAAGIALLALILQSLFEIDQKVTPRDDARWFPSFNQATPMFTQEVRRRAQRKPTRLRWIGVTQEAGWPLTQNLLLDVLNNSLGPKASVHVELAVLDPDGAVCKRADGPDSQQIRTTLQKVERFARDNRPSLDQRGCSLTIIKYDHRPTWHALLIDDDLLFYSTAVPGNLPFAAPQGGVEVVAASAGDPEAARVQHFIAWFTALSSEATAGTGPTTTAPAAPTT